MNRTKDSIAEALARSRANMRRQLDNQHTPATSPPSLGEQILAATDPRESSRAAMLRQCQNFPELRRGSR